MRKVVIGIESEFTGNILKGAFEEEGLNVVAVTSSGTELLNIIKNESADGVLLDVNVHELNWADVLLNIRNNEETKRMPVVIYSKLNTTDLYEKALDYEATDFIVATSNSPVDIALKVNIHLGKQRTYIFDVSQNEEIASDLISDLWKGNGLLCPKCNAKLHLYLLRDLSGGKNNFKVSFVCMSCSFRFGGVQ